MGKYKNRYRSETTRLKSHDYGSDDWYFVTICTNNREHYFGEITQHVGGRKILLIPRPVSSQTENSSQKKRKIKDQIMMKQSEMKYGQRNSKMLLDEVYFWTDTIKDWHKLLNDDFNKNVIINCWRNLIFRNKIKLYAFVIMPNHIHTVWEMLSVNGKEMPYASFNKFTAHQFLERVRAHSSDQIVYYMEHRDEERNHRFWQRDPLAVLMDSRYKVEQKIEYIHLNPLQEQWNLASRPGNYKWSSARFYETGTDEFNILTDYRERF